MASLKPPLDFSSETSEELAGFRIAAEIVTKVEFNPLPGTGHFSCVVLQMWRWAGAVLCSAAGPGTLWAVTASQGANEGLAGGLESSLVQLKVLRVPA